jgi:hypothetical protein
LATGAAFLGLAFLMTAMSPEEVVFGPLASGWMALAGLALAAVAGRYVATRAGRTRIERSWVRFAIAGVGLVAGGYAGAFGGLTLAEIWFSIMPCATPECGVGPSLAALGFGMVTGAVSGAVLALHATRGGLSGVDDRRGDDGPLGRSPSQVAGSGETP